MPHIQLYPNNEFRFRAVNGTHINILGCTNVKVSVGTNTFHHTFFVADIAKPILGTDFLTMSNTVIHMGTRQLKVKHDVLDFKTIPHDIAVTMLEKKSCFNLKNEAEKTVPNKNFTQDFLNKNGLSGCQFHEYYTVLFIYFLNTLVQLQATQNSLIGNSKNATSGTRSVDTTLHNTDNCISDEEKIQTVLAETRPVFIVHEISTQTENFEENSDAEIPKSPTTNMTVLDPDKTLVCNHPLDWYHPHESIDELKTKIHRCNSIVSDIDSKRENDIEIIRERFSSVFSPDISLRNDQPVKLEIKTSGDYKYPFIYPVPNAYREAAEIKINQMLEDGIIRRSRSRYASPLVCVPKKDGTVRLCVDYRNINKITIPDSYVIPRIDHLKQTIRGNIFSVLDLKEGFMQLLVDDIDIEKTAVATPWGLFEYLRMPFGLRNSPPTFQRFMDIVFHGVKNVATYIDDVIIFSETYTDHLVHLTNTFERLAKYGLIINVAKSKLILTTCIYLSLEFSCEGYRPVESCLPKIMAYPEPKDRKDIQKFMGVINYYRSHIPNLAQIATPLYNLTQGKKKFVWTTVEQTAFDTLKRLCQERMILVPFREKVPLDLYTDASEVAMGAVLTVEGKPMEFFSRKFTGVEQRYSTHEREALAMVISIQHFRPILTARKFVLHSDHRPLEHWLSTKPANERHARWMVKVQDMDFSVKYIKGEDNVLADLMSRPPGLEKTSLEDFHAEVREINAVHLIDNLTEIKALQTEALIKSCRLAEEEIEIVAGAYYNIASGNPQLILPEQFRLEVIKSTHMLGHYGIKRTLRALTTMYFWPGMATQVANFIMRCDQCQINKKAKVPKRVYKKFPQTSRFKTVHMDIVGPLPRSSRGSQYILTIMDRFSRWIEAIPMRSSTSNIICEKFFSCWIVRFGIPDYLITDQGSQFEGDLFQDLLARLGIQRNRTTAYHPQSNGLIERAHSTLKNSIRCLANQFPDWEKALPSALYAMRTAISNLGTSPSLVIYGEQIAIPSVLVSSETHYCETNITQFVQAMQSDMNILRTFLLTEDNALRAPTLEEDANPEYPYTSVWLKDPIRRGGLAPKYFGPFNVVHVRYPVITIHRGGHNIKVNVDRLKPAFKLTRHLALEEADLPLIIADDGEDRDDNPLDVMYEEIPLVEPYYADQPEALQVDDPMNLEIAENDPVAPLGGVIPPLNIADRGPALPGRTGSGRATRPPDRYIGHLMVDEDPVRE